MDKELKNETIEAVLERISNGDTLLRCGDLIDRRLWYDWVNEDPDLALRFEEAQRRFSAMLIDQCVDIADHTGDDWKTRVNRRGEEEEVFNREHVERSRLRIHTRMRIAAIVDPDRWAPQKKLDVTSGGKALKFEANRVEAPLARIENLLGLAGPSPKSEDEPPVPEPQASAPTRSKAPADAEDGYAEFEEIRFGGVLDD